jgi:hypothetical protein
MLDPAAPSNRGLHLSIGTNGGVNISETLASINPSWSLALTIATIESNTGGTLSDVYTIRGSINVEDWFGFLAYIDNGGGGANEHYFIYTENGGSSWNYSLIANFATGFSSWDVVPHVISGSLTLYASLHRNNDIHIYKSVNKGASWSAVSTPAVTVSSGDRLTVTHCPYQGNTDGQLVYFSKHSPGATGTTHKSTDGGVNLTQLNYTGSTSDGVQIRRSGFEAYTGDSSRLFWWRQSNRGLYISANGGSSWAAASMTGLSGVPTAGGGFPTDGEQYYVVTNSGIFVTIDAGANFIDKTGDWAFGFTGSGTEPYHNIIVPDWTE